MQQLIHINSYEKALKSKKKGWSNRAHGVLNSMLKKAISMPSQQSPFGKPQQSKFLKSVYIQQLLN